MKKVYQKPTMKVYEMKSKTALLVGSGDEKSSPKRHGGEFGYIPGVTEDEKLLA